ncbi:hypothetical protein [Sinomicrobium soli]|uniref:hypothetical protein n=1 Tax=Sinomicrobium sp. N-1-3-6 TaxID=2219864 RepID=UPI000DCF3559|nr:hypothetical protein [Sinomicrobium sp. N-1-3-6]RAV29218.1 hypothetical protein DN748_09880 [Sinomicrobium sp. N-1-3-6]
MNYVHHLNTVFEKFRTDPRLHPGHISLYMALFRSWNQSGFAASFRVRRAELMPLAAIRSSSTYHRYMSDLHRWQYVDYLPSKNAHLGSQVRMCFAGGGAVPVTGRHCPTGEPGIGEGCSNTGQGSSQMGHHRPTGGTFIKTIKQTNPIGDHYSPISKHAIETFFKAQNWPLDEAHKFFHHYQSTGWKTAGGISITNWSSAAEKWMLRVAEYQKGRSRGQEDHLKTTKAKNYAQPL